MGLILFVGQLWVSVDLELLSEFAKPDVGIM